MARALTREEEKQVLELFEKGYKPKEVSGLTGIPYHPVKRRRGKWLRDRKIRGSAVERKEQLREKLKSMSPQELEEDLHACILKYLANLKYGSKYKTMKRCIGKGVLPQLRQLRKFNLVVYREGERYWLTDEGKRWYKELFES